MGKKKILLAAAILSLGAFVACGESKTKAELQGLNNFSYMVGYRVQLPAPSNLGEIGENLDYSVKVTKPSGSDVAVEKTENGYAFVTDVVGAYSIVYTVVNAENEMFTKTITVMAEADTEKPVLSEVSAVSGLTIGDTFIVPAVLGTDNSLAAPYNGTLSYTVTLVDPNGASSYVQPQDSVLLKQHGEYSLSYVATDKAGNASEAKTVTFSVEPKGNAVYKVEHYLENLDGTFTLAESATQTLEAMIGSVVEGEENQFEHYLFDEGNEQGVLSTTVQEDGSSVLKLYYVLTKYTVKFDTDGGGLIANQIVKHGATLAKPQDPIKDGETFDVWTQDGFTFDFSTPIEGDITLFAAYKETDRYGLLLGDGTGAGWGHDPAENYACESSIAFTQFEGENVMALTLKDTDRTKTSPAYLKIDRAGNYAAKMRLASTKQYIGFRVYSPVQGAQIDVLIHNGSKVVKKWYRVQKGWNEFSIDIQKFVAGSQVVIDEETPIYRLGLGVYGDKSLFGEGTETTNAEYTFYFDEVYATNYDVSNIVDFESVGDLNRYSDGTSVYAYYRYTLTGGATAESGVEYDNEHVLKVSTTTNAYGSIVLNGAPNSNYTQVWFPTDLSAYSKIRIRAKVDDASQYLRIYLRNYNTELGETVNKIANTVAYAEIIKGSTEWVEYELDLTAIDDSLLTTVSQMIFDTAGNTAGNSFYIDYIQFIY